jgi:hypothetical protein
VRTPSITGYRLSTQQERIWQLQQESQVESPAYLTWSLMAIHGESSSARMVAALRCLVARHDILRTCFRSVADLMYPLQVIASDASITVEQYDLTDLSDDIRTWRLTSIVDELISQPFQLDRGPLCRFMLAHMSADSQALAIVVPIQLQRSKQLSGGGSASICCHFRMAAITVSF